MKKLLLLLLLYSACETVVEIDIPKDEPRLVLNSFFNPDSTFSISLFQSMYILDTGEFKAVENATVSIFDTEGTKLTELIDTGSGNYTSLLKPEAGKEYRIEALKAGFDTVEASDLIPVDSAQVSSIELNSTEPEFEGGSAEYDISFVIKDYAGDDFYEVQILEHSIFKFDSVTYENTYPSFLESDDRVFDEFTSSGVALIFRDVLFNEGESKITVSTYLNLEDNCDEFVECIEREFFLIIRKVSESYFNYNRTLRLQQDLEGNPFAEPVSVFNNITNGFGIFAGYRDSKFILEAAEN